MPTPQSKEARRFYLVAFLRLEDGQVLLRDGVERYSASIYLTGYAVECILKAVILSNTPASLHANILLNEFRGSRAHDWNWLRQRMYQANKIAIPPAIRLDLISLSTWSVDLRYTPGNGDGSEAAKFVNIAIRIVNFFAERCS